MRRVFFSVIIFTAFFISGCISPDNETVEGTGTPDITECRPIEGVLDGADFVPKSALLNHEEDGRSHPDLFYIGWAQLDTRADLRFPARGYDDTGFEDKLLVSRKQKDGTYKTWQIYPALDNNCKDVEKVRIHSFDVAPDGKSLYISMSKPVFADSDTLKENDLNPNRNLGIFKLEIATKKITPVTHNYNVSYMYPTYIGNDETTNHEMLLVAKTVEENEIPINYKVLKNVMLDEYDRHPAPLIHKLDTVTGNVVRIGFNNSHQTDPVVIRSEKEVPLVVFTQWEHHASLDRFALWKMQIDGSDNFTFFGEEATIGTNKTASVFQAREIKSGIYKGYLIMTQGARTNHRFASEGHILMTKRENMDLRSDKIFLQLLDNASGNDLGISRTPDHYNDESFVYSYRSSIEQPYGIYVKDYPTDINASVNLDAGKLVLTSPVYHFVQPRSFYAPKSRVVAPGVSDVSENRVSFTNMNLNGKSGFLVEKLSDSDNGVQNQLDGIDTENIRVQFFIPSHTFSHSQTIGFENSPEMSIPSSNFIKPESDGSLGVILKNGLYTWKVNKRFVYTDANGNIKDIWIPIRAERQEVSFVPNRVNACNQCHQDRNQAKIDEYKDYFSIANHKMNGDLTDLLGSDKDITDFNASNSIPDFHKDIIPLFHKPSLSGGKSCADCHNSKDKLNLSNKTGITSKNATYYTFVAGASKLSESEVLPYLYPVINPMGMDNNHHPAPFMWSLLLNDDLTLPPDDNHSNVIGRNLDRDGDYGAKYSEDVIALINTINTKYDHSKHWSAEDLQKFITFTSTRIPVGLSDKIEFEKNSLAINTPAAQKAYQSMVKNCFDCHNNHIVGGVDDANFGLPKEKRFDGSYLLHYANTRFVIKSHIAEKNATKFSMYDWQSNLTSSMSSTLTSALYRIDFNDTNNSEILVYARGGYDANGSENSLNDNIKEHPKLTVDSADYLAIYNWINGIPMTNESPVVNNPVEEIVIKEYDEPALIDTPITWSDPDDPLSQVLMSKQTSNEHIFSDTMLAFEYLDFNSAKIKTYAILGDRGENNFTFVATDGLYGSQIQKVPVRVTSDYNVPTPTSTLPKAYAYFTDRNTTELKKIDTNGSVVTIGEIEGYSKDWTTVYRRADKGWLYFLNQNEQKIYVVDENNASLLHTITLNHEPLRETASHKMTLYLLWWRPAEGNESDPDNYKAGELQGLLESKLSETKNGDFYVYLGDGESNATIVPTWRVKMPDGGNTIGIYVWRRATFMTKWVNEGIDRLNVLNLVTGKYKSLGDFTFEEKSIDGVDYNATSYYNVRAIVVAEDGAFYGFNKDLNSTVETFNFDPLTNIQKPVDVPSWLQNYIENFTTYATPFLVIEAREEEE